MRTRSCVGVAIGLALAIGFVVGSERAAEACGGCFNQAPSGGETPSVVTDHSMILSVSQSQTTLYDQIRYSGSPAAFAWVLPIAGTAKIALSSDTLFQVLGQRTATTIVAPPRRCPPPPNCGSGSSGASSAPGGGFGTDSGVAAMDGGVTVLGSQVVGPYATVTLAATDPDALADWLATNGFVIPSDVSPVIAQYVNEKFNFLAMKLIPGAGIDRMRPVSVTVSGASAVLPLRMVAAGTGPVVGVTLYVAAEGRYEPQNFPLFHIDDSELAWDWKLSQSNYRDLRKARTDAGGGKIWELEASVSLLKSQIEAALSMFGPIEYDPVAKKYKSMGGYLAVTDNGTITKGADDVLAEDLSTLFAGAKGGSLRLTRLRADLAHAALDKDLTLTASPDQAERSNVRIVTKELNEPLCPVYEDCKVVGQAPRSEAQKQAEAEQEASAAAAAGNGETSFSCTLTTGTNYVSGLSIAGLGGYVAFVLARRRRRS